MVTGLANKVKEGGGTCKRNVMVMQNFHVTHQLGFTNMTDGPDNMVGEATTPGNQFLLT